VHGSLYGMPILLKDNIDTGDRMLTRLDSLALNEQAPPMQKLRAEKFPGFGLLGG
jgi:amidase